MSCVLGQTSAFSLGVEQVQCGGIVELSFPHFVCLPQFVFRVRLEGLLFSLQSQHLFTVRFRFFLYLHLQVFEHLELSLFTLVLLIHRSVNRDQRTYPFTEVLKVLKSVQWVGEEFHMKLLYTLTLISDRRNRQQGALPLVHGLQIGKDFSFRASYSRVVGKFAQNPEVGLSVLVVAFGWQLDERSFDLLAKLPKDLHPIHDFG